MKNLNEIDAEHYAVMQELMEEENRVRAELPDYERGNRATRRAMLSNQRKRVNALEKRARAVGIIINRVEAGHEAERVS